VDQRELKIICEDLLNESITDITPIPGGDINQSYQIDTIQNVYFCKANNSDIGEDLVQKEIDSLHSISRYCTTPDIISSAPSVLILSWIKSGNKTRFFWEKLGTELATLHKVSSNQFGFESHNYIGTLLQTNVQSDSWDNFYMENRLLPQFKLAVDKAFLHGSEIPIPEKISQRIKDVCPSEIASLIHGDLWSGNIIGDTNSNSYFIDPCASWAHREMDIAMSSLFGKFDDRFYEVYNEAHPLEKGWKNRLDIYHLYYLLAHLNMFGIGYKNDVLKIVKRYFG